MFDMSRSDYQNITVFVVQAHSVVVSVSASVVQPGLTEGVSVPASVIQPERTKGVSPLLPVHVPEVMCNKLLFLN